MNENEDSARNAIIIKILNKYIDNDSPMSVMHLSIAYLAITLASFFNKKERN